MSDARRAAVVAMERMRIGAEVETVAAPPAPFVQVQAFGSRFLADHAPHWKQITQAANAKTLRILVYPVLGSKRVAHLTRSDIKVWREALTCAPGSINRAMAVLSGMMRHAEVLGLRPPGSNPCKGLRKKETDFKASYLSKTGYLNLGRALRSLSNEAPVEVAVLRFLALTGCRRSEARLMEWEWVTEDAVNLPDSKTGPRSIWLGEAARDVLTGLERRGRFVSAEGGRPIPDHRIAKVWETVRARMKKPKLRVHDLRHSFASVGVSHGEDLGTIGGLLGHADKNTTIGYAHLADKPLREAADRVGDLIAVKSKLDRANTARSAKMKPVKAKKAAKPEPKSPPAETWADVRAFLRSKAGINSWCKQRDLDPEELRSRIRECRAQLGGVL